MLTRIECIAEAIKLYEGWHEGSRSFRNNNPGNLRYMGLPTTRRDEGGYAIFPSYEAGWQALLRLLRRAINGKSKIYKPQMTMLQFFTLYAPSWDHNQPLAYASFVCHHCGLKLTTTLKEIGEKEDGLV